MAEFPSKNRASAHWVWGLFLILLGVFFLLTQFIPPTLGGLVWAAVMAAVGLAFLSVYLSNRANWWALIPAYVFVAIGGVIALATIGFPEGGIAAYVMMAIALPFYVVYLRNRANWWALIPAYAMTALAVLVLLPTRLMAGELVAAYVVFAIALPFLYVYVRNRRHWWALIPGGIAAAVGVGLLVAGVAYVIPTLMIVVGIYLLVRYAAAGARREPSPEAPAEPRYGPQADKPRE